MTTYQPSTPVARTQSNGLAIASLVCGIVGLIFFAFILGPLAIIFGGVARSRARRGADHGGMAIAGLVLGILDIVLFAAIIAAASHNGGSFYFHAG